MAKKRPQHTKIDIVLSSSVIKMHLKSRFKELSLSYSDVVRDARDKKLELTNSHLSVYFNNAIPVTGYPTQKHVIWLCLRYRIKIRLDVDSILPFSEEQAIINLKKFFPY